MSLPPRWANPSPYCSYTCRHAGCGETFHADELRHLPGHWDSSAWFAPCGHNQSAVAPQVTWSETQFRSCKGCGEVYHLSELVAGDRKHGTHPDHSYAPCGCSQQWCGADHAYPVGAEREAILRRAGQCIGCELPLETTLELLVGRCCECGPGPETDEGRPTLVLVEGSAATTLVEAA